MDAVIEASTAVRLDDSPWTRAAAVEVQWDRGQPHEALRDIRQAAEMARDPGTTQMVRSIQGPILIELHRLEEAIRVLEPLAASDHPEAEHGAIQLGLAHHSAWLDSE